VSETKLYLLLSYTCCTKEAQPHCAKAEKSHCHIALHSIPFHSYERKQNNCSITKDSIAKVALCHTLGNTALWQKVHSRPDVHPHAWSKSACLRPQTPCLLLPHCRTLPRSDAHPQHSQNCTCILTLAGPLPASASLQDTDAAAAVHAHSSTSTPCRTL